MYKSSKHTLHFLTTKKLNKIKSFFCVYAEDLQEYINLILDDRLEYNELGLSSKRLPIFNIHDSRYRQIIYKHACVLIKKHFIKVVSGKKLDIEKHNIEITIDERLLDFKLTPGGEFDEFIGLKLEHPITHKLEIVKIPVQHHRLFRKYKNDDRWVLKSTIKLSRRVLRKNRSKQIIKKGDFELVRIFQLRDSYFQESINKKETELKKRDSTLKTLEKVQNYYEKEQYKKYILSKREEKKRQYEEESAREAERVAISNEVDKYEMPYDINNNRYYRILQMMFPGDIGNQLILDYAPYILSQDLKIYYRKKEKFTEKVQRFKKLNYHAMRFYAETNGVSVKKAYEIFRTAYNQSKKETIDCVVEYGSMVCPGLARQWLRNYS